MHAYGTDSDERRFVPIVLGVLALVITYLIHAGLASVGVSPPWWLDVPTPLAAYGALWLVFDNFAWNWPVTRRARLVRVPDYRGEWKVSGLSDYGARTPFSGSATIRQTWSKISIQMETAQSRSASFTAAVMLAPSAWPTLTYQYVNAPKAHATQTLQGHHGTASLEMRQRDLSGEYYGGRGSKNVGTMSFVRVAAS